jgi:hypothetical protein
MKINEVELTIIIGFGIYFSWFGCEPDRFMGVLTEPPFLIKEYPSTKIITGYIFYGPARWSEPRSQKQFFLLSHKMR